MSARDQSTGLFGGAQGAAAGPIVFLTNRFNLLEILSSGLVTPRVAFAKFYSDFLEVAQGRIPLFQAPLSVGLCARASSRDDSALDNSAFPVAIEIDPARLVSTPVTALSNDGATKAISLQRGRARVWAAGGAIPGVAFRRIHFRSASDLEEHKLREYDNIFPNQPASAVSPELFENGAWDTGDVEKWLASLTPVTAPSPDEFSLYDRLSGARCLAAHAASAEQMDDLATFLGARGTSPTGQPHGFPPWLSAENTIRPRESGWRGKTSEERLYCSAVRVLQRLSPAQGWLPLEILAEVKAAVAATQLPKKDEVQLSKQFAAMGAILRNDKEFKPFRSGVGNPVVKALLMVLMRPEPARLLNWSRADNGADHDVHLTAAVLSGVLQGHKRLSTDYRLPDLDRLIAITAATQMCERLHDVFRPVAKRIQLNLSVQATGTEGETTVTLSSDGAVVIKKQGRPRVLADLIGTLDLMNPNVSRAITDVCVEQGWTECVRSVVTTTDRNWSAPRSGGAGFEIMVQGPVSVRVEVEIDALRERLGRGTLTAAEEAYLASRLRAAGMAGDAPKPSVDSAVSPSTEPRAAKLDAQSSTPHTES